MTPTQEHETVRDRMSNHVVTMPASETLDHAAQVMVERGVGSAVVMKGRNIEGIITERDVLRAVAHGLVPWSTNVSDCMTADPATVSPTTGAGAALRMMLDNNYRHLPVVENGGLVGIVSLRDLAGVAATDEDVDTPASEPALG
ncbi:MAG: cyclic nucleotide-binding/CBS domain-containing protein [Actinomycetota bacterium]